MAGKDRCATKKKNNKGGRVRQARKQVVQKINLRPIYLVGSIGKINLCRSKSGGNIGVLPEGSF